MASSHILDIVSTEVPAMKINKVSVLRVFTHESRTVSLAIFWNWASDGVPIIRMMCNS